MATEKIDFFLGLILADLKTVRVILRYDLININPSVMLTYCSFFF